jgi:hypothetical protein
MRFLLTSMGLLTWLSATPAFAEDVSVTSIEAFLVYGYTGKLSSNIADVNGNFSFWNSIINDAEGQEPADNVLIVAHFEKNGNWRLPVFGMKAVEKKSGKILTKRQNMKPSFIDGNIAAEAMLVHNIGCTNFDVVVSVGKTRKTINLPFKCGE